MKNYTIKLHDLHDQYNKEQISAKVLGKKTANRVKSSPYYRDYEFFVKVIVQKLENIETIHEYQDTLNEFILFSDKATSVNKVCLMTPNVKRALRSKIVAVSQITAEKYDALTSKGYCIRIL